MITRVSTIKELKQLFIEGLLNKTNKITKVSDESIVNGVAYGTAKIAQKALKEIALVESHLFPDDAFGQNLDIVAQRLGISPRFGSSGSSAYIRLVGSPGTTYTPQINVFFGQGVTFNITETITIGSSGFAYAKVRSQGSGLKTNVPSLTINTVNPAPSGHLAVLNEYEATGGRSVEDDHSLKLRIKNGANISARGTLEYLTQVLLRFDQNILQAYSSGMNDQGQQIVALSSQNGMDFTQDELNQLLRDASPYLSLGQYNSITNTSVNVVFENVQYNYIDVDFRLELVQNANADEVRRNIQIAITKYLDPRFWKPTQRVEWDDILRIVKETSQVKNVADQYFIPRVDMIVDPGRLPKIRGFIMRDLEGSIMRDVGGVISPSHYPAENDLSFQTTVVR